MSEIATVGLDLAKARQKDTHARWTMGSSKTPVDIAIPGFDRKSHVGIARAHG